MTARLPPQIAKFVDRALENLDRLDYYRVLGVGRQADSAEVRRAYYRLAGKLHPDVYGSELDAGDRRKLMTVFSRAVEAYRVLADADRRERYEQFLAEGRLRWDEGEARRPRQPSPELAVKGDGARRFFLLGLEALTSGDARSAAMNFRLALSLDPGNDVIVDKLAEAEGRERG